MGFEKWIHAFSDKDSRKKGSRISNHAVFCRFPELSLGTRILHSQPAKTRSELEKCQASIGHGSHRCWMLVTVSSLKCSVYIADNVIAHACAVAPSVVFVAAYIFLQSNWPAPWAS